MNKAQQRRIAIGAIRSELRRQNQDPKSVNANDALLMLDDLLRSEPNLVASQWYDDASANQIVLFKREWRKWQIS